MNLAAMLKRKKELLVAIRAFMDLTAEARTKEARGLKDADVVELKQLELDIVELQEFEELEARQLENTNGDAPTGDGDSNPDFRDADVQDQKIYRGNAPLGAQMVDIATMSKREGGAAEQEARGRFDSMIKREKVIAEKRAAGTGGHVEAVGEDGGFLLQGETSIDLITNGFNNSAILSRAANRDIGMSQFVELVGIDETSRVNGSRGGGVRVYTDKELALMTQSKTKFEKIRIEPKRLTGMYFASDEILNNAPILQGEMAELFDMEFAFKGQDLAINGSGAGEAMGVLTAPALVTVAKEAAQPAKTIVFQNLVNMKARIRTRNRASVIWVANQDIEPQLYTLSLPVGTGGSVMPVYVPSQDPTSEVAGTLLGIPIVFVEQCATLGTKGDIILADWSTYWAANKGGIESANSIHLKFDYNQTTFRFRTWFDGQPRMKSAITPYKGSNTVSAFVTLAARG